MDDFSPSAVARRVAPLSELLDARQQLAGLVTYMGGKPGAEDLIGKVINDQELLQALAAARGPAGSTLGDGLLGITLAGDELTTLLVRQFKPKTDDRGHGIEKAVQTLARRALAQTRATGSDV